MKNNLVSIIIPAYNRGETIVAALNSVKKQTYRPLEVIIVDDASCDNTKTILSEYDFGDLDKKIITNSSNLGISESRNLGIINSKGFYIGFLDSDDIWTDPDKLLLQVDFLKRNSFSFVGTKCTVSVEHPMKYELEKITNDIDCREIALSYFFIHINTWLLKKSLIKDLGLFWKHRCEDYEYLLRIGTFTKYGFIDKSTAHYNNQTGGDHTIKKIKTGITRFIIMIIYRKCYPHFVKYFLKRIGRNITPKKY